MTSSTDSEIFLRGARAFTLQPPPVQRVADVSEQIESLSDLSDEQLEKMEAVRDATPRPRRGGTSPRPIREDGSMLPTLRLPLWDG